MGLDYKDHIISKGGRELGLTFYDIEKILGEEQFGIFSDWISGQTCGFVDYSCTTSICYLWDYERFIRNLPVID